jgi:hypothetical protein
MKTPFKTHLIHSPLQAGFKRIDSCESTLQFGDGTVTAWLTKENQFGDDTFVLDIAYKESPNQNDEASQSLVPAIPKIRIFDSHDCEVSPISGHDAVKVPIFDPISASRTFNAVRLSGSGKSKCRSLSQNLLTSRYKQAT